MALAVPRSVDFERIRRLPRRVLNKAHAEALARMITPDLRCAGSRAMLRPWQAVALAEAVENDGAFLALPVGQGKTLIAELLPVVLHSRRSVLIIPASLREKTFADRAALRADWRLANPPPRIVTREELALVANERLLDQIAPDLIVIDEADELSNADRGAPKRVDRYVQAHAEVRVVVMTGTPSRNSIMAYWHLVCWALGERAPLPLRESEARLWAGCLDNKGPRGAMRGRIDPGPLGTDTESARAWFAARLRETPGVVIVDEDSAPGVPLTITQRLARECKILDGHFERFLVEQVNPDGIPVSDPLSRWRIDGQLGCGLYSYYDPAPPEEWREARLNLARFVRREIEASDRTSKPLDTEGQVLKRHADDPIVERWREVEDLFDPIKSTRTRWVSDATLRSVEDWLGESAAPGIVWCGSVEFAERLARETGLPYYGAEGRDARGRGLHAAPVENLIASWNANKKGFNLQPWTRQLIVMPPQSAKWLEQIFGRSHRAGQTRAVTISILITSGGTLDGFESSISEAEFTCETVSLTQKIMRADIVRATPTVTASNRFRWARR